MTVHERFMTHMKPSTTKNRHTYKLYMAIKKYGRENFYVETLESGIPIELLDKKEIEYISQYDSYYHGYNSTKGGDGRIINLIENEDELLTLATNGMPATELAEYYHLNVATIYRTLHKLGFYYNEIDEESIVSDLLSGMKQDEVAQKYNINKMTITRILNKKEIRFNKKRIGKRDDFSIDALKADYDKQMPIKDICEKYDISETTFYRIKKDHNFNTRKQLYTNVTHREDINEIKKDYMSGMSIQKIANKYGLSYNSARRIIIELDWKRA